jgi:hypothetical protein
MVIPMAMRQQLRAVLSSRALTLALCVCVIVLMSTVVATSALAYEGPFCTKKSLKASGRCQSSEVSGIRRAVGRSEGGSTEIAVVNQYGESTNKCRETSCEVGTEYLKSGTGYGEVINIGTATHNYYGYLYP